MIEDLDNHRPTKTYAWVSKYNIGDFVRFVNNDKILRGWVLEIKFNGTYIFYEIQGENNAVGKCYIYEAIEQKDILGIAELE